jgi:hypothetical protein
VGSAIAKQAAARRDRLWRERGGGTLTTSVGGIAAP